MTDRGDLGLSITAERVLRQASSVGNYMPRTKEQFHICQALLGKGYIEPSDTLPGSFGVTLEGENAVKELEEVV